MELPCIPSLDKGKKKCFLKTILQSEDLSCPLEIPVPVTRDWNNRNKKYWINLSF